MLKSPAFRRGGRVNLTVGAAALWVHERILALHREARGEITGRNRLSSASLCWRPVPFLVSTTAALAKLVRLPQVRVRATVSDRKAFSTSAAGGLILGWSAAS